MSKSHPHACGESQNLPMTGEAFNHRFPIAPRMNGGSRRPAGGSLRGPRVTDGAEGGCGWLRVARGRGIWLRLIRPLHNHIWGTASDADLENRLSRLMEDDCDTVKLGFGASRPNTSPMAPLLAQLLKARARMYQNVEGGDKTTTPEEVRESTSALLVTSALICGGVNDGELPESLTVAEWASRVSASAKNFGGVLGQTRECRAATYKYRRQYGALNTEKMVLSAVEAFRIGDERDMKTEVCGGLGYYLKSALTKIEAGLPEYVRASRRDYSNEIGMGGVEEAIKRYSHGNIYFSRPQALIQEEVAQYRKRKTEETQILSGDPTKKKTKSKKPEILADSQPAGKKDRRLEHPAGAVAGFAVGAGRGVSPVR